MKRKPKRKPKHTMVALTIAALTLVVVGSHIAEARTSKGVVTESDVQKAQNDFSFALHKKLAHEAGTENVFSSGFSAHQALAMTASGAKGDTLEEMARVLNVLDTFDSFNATAASRLEKLDKINEATTEEGKTPTELSIVNRLWAEKSFKLEAAFTKNLKKNYTASLDRVDFKGDPDGARKEINEAIAKSTKDKIRDLLPKDAVTSETRLTLTNAVYFMSTWEHPFNPDETNTTAAFTKLSGDDVTVSMMRHKKERFLFVEKDNYKAVELPYADGRTAMTVILPDEGAFLDVEKALSADDFAETVDEMAKKKVNLALPKFEMTHEAKLKEPLQALGMKTAFGNGADFSAISSAEELRIDEVYHKAFIKVDESGTEAAAATAVVMTRKGGAMKSAKFIANRPFIFVIRDTETNTVLFMGRVMDPTK